MILLLAFAFLAGAATAITPCVLPVLPALLSASGTGGRRRPIGIVTGLTLTHTITIVGVASVVDGVGVGDGDVRTVAIVVLALFGITLLVPRAAEGLQAAPGVHAAAGAARRRGRVLVGPARRRRARLRLRALRRPDPRGRDLRQRVRGHDGRIVAVGIAYGLGSAVVLLGLALGGRGSSIACAAAAAARPCSAASAP